MNRAFRVPILPALQGAARARFSSATTTQSNNNSSNNPSSTVPPNLALNNGTDAQQQYYIGDISTKTINEKMRLELVRIKSRLDLSLSFKDVQNLVHVHAMMEIYRRYRDATGIVNASEPLHAILMILRLRSKVLKPVISKVRRQIMGTQNQVLSKYLNEIADDLATGRSYASRFAITYLLTAFTTMEEHAQAAHVWKKLNDSSSAGNSASESSDQSQSLMDKLRDPRVVSAALRSSDPSVVSLEDFEKTYKETTERHGRYLLADEALAMGYLRFKEFSNAVKMYTSMCDLYDVNKWETSLVRLHNNILTECTDISIADVFFETAVSEESFICLHPSAAASYIGHLYDNTGDISRVVKVYERAMHCLKTQEKGFGQANFMNLTAECLKCIVQREFALLGPTTEARALLERVYRGEDQIVLNAVLSVVSKTWTAPDYITYLQQQFPPVSDLQFDAVRILLNSSQSLSIEQCNVERIDELWQHLCSLKHPQVFDWLSLAKACNNADRAAYLVKQFAQAKLNAQNLNSFFVRLDASPISRAALIDANLVYEGQSSGPFSPAEIESELNARSKNDSKAPTGQALEPETAQTPEVEVEVEVEAVAEATAEAGVETKAETKINTETEVEAKAEAKAEAEAEAKAKEPVGTKA